MQDTTRGRIGLQTVSICAITEEDGCKQGVSVGTFQTGVDPPDGSPHLIGCNMAN